MKPAFIIVLFKTPQKEIDRLKKEIKKIGFASYSLFFIDNTKNNIGYAGGVNLGIKKALQDKCDYIVVANPDISFKSFTTKNLFQPKNNFDIWGFAMKQNNKVYYGGEIDPWNASGGLLQLKPKFRFQFCDFISGSLMIFKSEILDKVGYFNEDYFMYYEDVDFCFRARKLGLKIGIDSEIVYEHFEVSSDNHEKSNLLFNAHKTYVQNYGTSLQKTHSLAKRIIKSSFLMNFMSLNISSVTIKLLHFLSFIFLIKYLNASEYGIYTLVWTQVLLLSPLLDFGTTSYSIVNINNEKKHSMQSLFNLRFVVSIFIFILTLILSLILFRSNTKVYLYIFIMATVIFTNTFSGSYFIFNALKNKLYISSRNSIIFNAIVIIGTIISLVIYRRLLIVFIIIFLCYNGYTLVNILLLKKEMGNFRFKINLPEWKIILKQSYIYILISFFAGLYFKIDILLLTALKGINEVGIYSAGYKFFDALLFIAASYNVTATPILARLSQDRNKLFAKVKKDIIFLLSIGLLIVIGVWLFAPIILPRILKTSYSPSISVLNIVILALPLIFFNSVFMNLLYIFKKAHLVIYMFVFQSIVNASLNWFLIPKYSFYSSAWITVASELINAIIILLICKVVWNKVFTNKLYENKR